MESEKVFFMARVGSSESDVSQKDQQISCVHPMDVKVSLASLHQTTYLYLYLFFYFCLHLCLFIYIYIYIVWICIAGAFFRVTKKL